MTLCSYKTLFIKTSGWTGLALRIHLSSPSQGWDLEVCPEPPLFVICVGRGWGWNSAPYATQWALCHHPNPCIVRTAVIGFFWTPLDIPECSHPDIRYHISKDPFSRQGHSCSFWEMDISSWRPPFHGLLQCFHITSFRRILSKSSCQSGSSFQETSLRPHNSSELLRFFESVCFRQVFPTPSSCREYYKGRWGPL